MEKVMHTPGPWVIDTETRSVEVCTIHGIDRLPTEDGAGQGWCYIRGDDLSEHWSFAGDLKQRQIANARLVAASPDMLALLREIVDEFGCTIDQYNRNGADFTHKDGTQVFHVSTLLDRDHLISRARAIIARVEGGEL